MSPKLLPLEMGIYYLVWATLKQPSNVPPLYDDFLKSSGDDVAFATLNYDLLLETIFGRNQCAWYYPLQGEMKLFRRRFRIVDLVLDDSPELIAVDEQADDQIVHPLRLRKAERPAHQPLDPCP
jgi:hypothetical protein